MEDDDVVHGLTDLIDLHDARLYSDNYLNYFFFCFLFDL